MRNKIILITGILFFSNLTFGQINSEGRQFLLDFFYSIPLNSTKIKTINILNKQSANFYKISASGILGSNTTDCWAKSNPYLQLSESQKQRRAINFLEYYENNKSVTKKIVLRGESGYLNYNAMRNLFLSITDLGFDLQVEKTEDSYAKIAECVFYSSVKAMNNHDYFIYMYLRKNIGDPFVLGIQFNEENLNK